MAATSDPTIRNATRVKFDRLYKEFQVSMNPLKGWFEMEKTLSYQGYFDYLNRVDVASGDRKANITNANRLAATPAAQIPTWRRRVNQYLESPLHVAVPRVDAKRLGKTHPVLVDEYSSLFRMEMAREAIRMTLKLLQESYVENPAIADQTTAGVTHVFPDASEHMFASSGTLINATAKTVAIPPRLNQWWYLTNSLANARQIGIARGGQLSEGTGIPKKKCLVICSNTAFTLWKDSNADLVANRDTFGKDVYLGMGKLYDFQEYSFLTLPDTFMPRTTQAVLTNSVATGGIGKTTLRFPIPSTWTSLETPLLTGASAPKTGGTVAQGQIRQTDNQNDVENHVLPVNTYPMLVVEPNAFRLGMPKQTQVPLTEYRDFKISFEKFIFGNLAMEGVRLFDSLVRRLWVTGNAQTVTYVSE